MKKIILSLSVLICGTTAMAGSYVCSNRTQHILIKQGSSSLYMVYECANKELSSCTPGGVFEALGFESEGSFSLHGKRFNGHRAIISMVQSKNGWNASLGSGTQYLQGVLACVSYSKK